MRPTPEPQWPQHTPLASSGWLSPRPRGLGLSQVARSLRQDRAGLGRRHGVWPQAPLFLRPLATPTPTSSPALHLRALLARTVDGSCGPQCQQGQSESCSCDLGSRAWAGARSSGAAHSRETTGQGPRSWGAWVPRGLAGSRGLLPFPHHLLNFFLILTGVAVSCSQTNRRQLLSHANC